MNKRITIIGINYFPEDSAIGLYTTQKVERLIKMGYDVTVITGFPYYPHWEILKSYKNKPYLFSETINGVKVYRVKQYVPGNPTFFKRILLLVSYTFGSIFNLIKSNKPDIVISIIPFTTSVILGLLLKWRYNAKLWVHIQDFEFDAAVDAGLFNKKTDTIFKTLIWFEKRLLNKANIVSTISHGMINRLRKKTITNTFYLPNWIDTALFSNPNLPTHEFLKTNKFKILYSGNIGAKQDWQLFIRLAKALKDVEDIEVVIVGEGAEKNKVVNALKSYDFIKHYNLIPFSQLPSLLASADMHILLLKTEVIDTVMPSKLLGMMASGNPSLVTANSRSEVYKVLQESKGGFSLDGTSIEDLKKHILTLKENKQLRTELGLHAKSYVKTHFSKDKVLDNFSNEIKKL